MNLSIDHGFLNSLRTDIFNRVGSQLEEIRITDLVLDQIFTVTRLNTGHVGFSMNYGVVYSGREKMKLEAQRFNECLETDPLLNRLWDLNYSTDELLRTSLQASLLSALSKRLLENKNESFIIQRGDFPLKHIIKPGDVICIIGFGGYLREALRSHELKRVYLADFHIDHPRKKQEIEKLCLQYPDVELLTSDGSQNAEILEKSDIACITASVLSNGSLSGLLNLTKKCRKVILEGHSGHIYPVKLFELGIDTVTTSVFSNEQWPSLKKWCDENPQGDMSQYIDKHLREKVSFFQ